MDGAIAQLRWIFTNLLILFGVGATLITCALGVVEFMEIADDTAEIIVASTLLAVVILVVACVVAREVQTARKEKYANITDGIHHVLHNVRDLNTFLLYCQEGRVSDDEAAAGEANRCLAVILDGVTTIFSMVTGTRCRACIKAFERDDRDWFAIPIARDTASRQRLFDLDERRLRERNDRVDLNDHVAALVDGNVPYYFNNDLPGTKRLQSTSLRAYAPDNKDYQRNSIWTGGKLADWPLPYRSTIVCAIRYKTRADAPHVPADGSIGFLCIDSESRGVFKQRWDIPLALALADALFTPLKLYGQLWLGGNDAEEEFEEERG